MVHSKFLPTYISFMYQSELITKDIKIIISIASFFSNLSRYLDVLLKWRQKNNRKPMEQYQVNSKEKHFVKSIPYYLPSS